MSRAKRKARRKAERAEKKAAEKKMGGEISLQNPVAQHFESFIFGNSTKCDHVVAPDTGVGKTVVICGAGPSLREHAAEYCPQGDEVWGVNSALTWLYENGHKVTHGLTVDQTPTMLKEWLTAPPVDYMIASTCHPHLTDYLQGKDLHVEFFHNFVGLDKPPVKWEDENGEERTASFEDWMYILLYKGTLRAGSGLNGVTRAIDVARYKKFDRIVVLGSDCAMHATGKVPDGLMQGSPAFTKWLAENTDFHVDGSSAVVNGQSALTIQGEIDGRLWTTKPDLMITAVTIAKMLQGSVPELEVIGDVLPNALRDKDDEFFDSLPTLTNHRGEPVRAH